MEYLTNYLIDHPLVLEVADRCSDTFYDDFNKSTYLEAIYRAEKRIALEYDILNRILYFKSKIIVPPEFEGDEEYLQVEKETSFDIPIHSFHNETSVIINSIRYDKVPKDSLVSDATYPKYQYFIYYSNNTYKMNYTERGLDDIVIINFTSDINKSDYEIEGIKPVLPPKFEDEILNRACVTVAKRGIAKFKGDKGDKFTKIFRMYSKEKLDIDVATSQAWIKVKPFDPFGEN